MEACTFERLDGNGIMISVRAACRVQPQHLTRCTTDSTARRATFSFDCTAALTMHGGCGASFVRLTLSMPSVQRGRTAVAVELHVARCLSHVRATRHLPPLPQSPPPAPRSSVRGGTGYCRVPSSLAASSRLRPLLLRVHCCGRSFHEPLEPCGASCCLSYAVCHVARHPSRVVDVVATHFMNSLRSLVS